MASSHSAPIGLRFGAELEVLTGSRANEHMEWYLTATELSKELGNAQVRNHVNFDHNKDAERCRGLLRMVYYSGSHNHKPDDAKQM
jgi:hypothetical protein